MSATHVARPSASAPHLHAIRNSTVKRMLSDVTFATSDLEVKFGCESIALFTLGKSHLSVNIVVLDINIRKYRLYVSSIHNQILIRYMAANAL